MKAQTLFCLVAFFLSTFVQAQDLSIRVNEKGKVGYADKDGNEIIKCQYESTTPFSNGIAIVTKSKKVGIIDTTGKKILPIKYDNISLWHNNLYLIKIGKKMGLADTNGNIILDVKYSHISKLNCYGKALIALGGKETANDKKSYMANAKYGIIDSNGNILIAAKYKGLYEFSYDCKDIYPYYEGRRLEYSYHNTTDTLKTDCLYLGFSKNNGISIYNAGVINGEGKEIVKQGLYYFVMLPQSDMVRYYIVKSKKTICGYHNINTGTKLEVATFKQNINNINYWSHGDFTGDIAPVNGESWSFVNKSGQVIRTDYQALKHCQHLKLWAAQNTSSTWDVFDENNNEISTLSTFADIGFPSNIEDKEIYNVKKGDKYGCITRSGEVVIPFNYDLILKNSYNTFGVKKDKKWGLLSVDNTTLIPTEYINFILPSEYDAKHLWVQKSDSLYYHINLNTNKVSATGYKVVKNFVDGFAHVVPTTINVEDTPINRAQIFPPNTQKETIDALEFEKNTNTFGYLIDTNDVLLLDMPISTLYKEMVIKKIKEYRRYPLTECEKKNILLEVTKENRSYDLKSTLGEDEWNY